MNKSFAKYIVCGVFCMITTDCKRTPPIVLFPSDVQQQTVTQNDSSTDAGTFAVLLSNAVTGDGSSFTLDGVTVRAPSNERFARYIAVDVDGDHDRDALVTRVSPDRTAKGVTFFLRQASGLVPVEIGGNADPTNRACANVDVRVVTSRSAVVTYQCATSQNGTSPNPAQPQPQDPNITVEEHILVALSANPVAKLRVGLLPTDPTTKLDVRLDVSDRDMDLQDDVAVSIGARLAADPTNLAVRAQVVYFERAGSYSLDVSEPERSFASITRTLISHPRDRRRALANINQTERLIRLRRSLCLESHNPRVRIGNTLGVACGASPSLPSVGEALARAYLVLGELPAAWGLVGPTEFGDLSRSRVVSDLRRAAPANREITIRQGPSIGPMDVGFLGLTRMFSLDPVVNPTRLVLHIGNAHVDLQSLAVVHSAEPGQPVDMLVQSPDRSQTLYGYYETCNGVAAVFCPSTNPNCRSAPTEIPPGATTVLVTDLPSFDFLPRCTPTPSSATPATSPVMRMLNVHTLGWGPQGLLLTIRGRLYHIPPGARHGSPALFSTPMVGPYAPGSMISSMGEYVVYPLQDQLIVRDRAGRWRSWAPTANPPIRYPVISALTISDDGRVVAANIGGGLYVFQHPTVLPDAGPVVTPLPTTPTFTPGAIDAGAQIEITPQPGLPTPSPAVPSPENTAPTE